MESDDPQPENPPGPSAIAQEIASLKESVSNAASKKSALPQPLFWSLFAHKINEIKRKKEVESVLREILES